MIYCLNSIRSIKPQLPWAHHSLKSLTILPSNEASLCNGRKCDSYSCDMPAHWSPEPAMHALHIYAEALTFWLKGMWLHAGDPSSGAGKPGEAQAVCGERQ